MGKTSDNAESMGENGQQDVGGSNASRACRGSTLKWTVAVIVSVNLLVFGVSSIREYRKDNRQSGQDAVGNIEAQVQASFMLHKPYSAINASVLRLESDIWEEVGISNSKVVIISLKPLPEPNWTEVVFGIVSTVENSSISSAGVSVLRAAFAGLALGKYNLSLTHDIFGRVYFFQVLMFPQGITVVPEQISYPLPYTQTLFNFTLYDSIVRLVRNLAQLKDQLKSGLRVRPNENLFVQLTNLQGSTIHPPIIVQTSIMPVVGKSLGTPRLKQLVQEITGSHARNLGLNHTLFGKVKKIKLSYFLRYKSSPAYVPSQVLPPSHPPLHSPMAAPFLNPSPVPSASVLYGHHAMPPFRSVVRAPSNHHSLAHCHRHHAFTSSNCADYVRHAPVSGLNEASSSFPSHNISPTNKACVHHHHVEAASVAPVMLLPPSAPSPQIRPHFKAQPCHCHLSSFPLASSALSQLGCQLVPSPLALSSQAMGHAAISCLQPHATGDRSVSSVPVSSSKSSDVFPVILTHAQSPESRHAHAELVAPVPSFTSFSSACEFLGGEVNACILHELGFYQKLCLKYIHI